MFKLITLTSYAAINSLNKFLKEHKDDISSVQMTSNSENLYALLEGKDAALNIISECGEYLIGSQESYDKIMEEIENLPNKIR